MLFHRNITVLGLEKHIAAQRLCITVLPKSETVLFSRFLSFLPSVDCSLAGSQKPADTEPTHLVTSAIIKERSKRTAHYETSLLKELSEMSNFVLLDFG